MLYGRIIGVVAVLVMGAAFVMGCGDDGEASANVTKAEFTKQAEAVCNERKQEWDAEVDAFNKITSEEGSFKEGQERAETFFTEFILPRLEKELEELENLDVPEADEATVEKMLESRSRGVAELQEKGEPKALLKEPFKTFEKEAKAYGLNCPPLL